MLLESPDAVASRHHVVVLSLHVAVQEDKSRKLSKKQLAIKLRSGSKSA
jgi:hypothetical protein